MMEERSENGEKVEDIMLPGFRFHPTDEELVGFYLKRKIQQRPLSIELIKQLDIYKYDPWDLPTLATTGEKEWYFYCPRDRKYRNSARPNRVTGAGFWKATGTDRPIYSSELGSKCIGLKKSLVFYKGRAAKGIKTDWMMHEFRLPSLSDHTVPSKRFIDKNIPANDLWAICRIFKKANSSTHRALTHPNWASPSPILAETTSSDHHLPLVDCQSTSNNFSSAIQYGITSSTPMQQHFPITTSTSFSPLHQIDHPFKPFNQTTLSTSAYKTPCRVSISSNEDLSNIGYTFLSAENNDQQPTNSTPLDASSLLFNMSSSFFGDFGKSSGSLDYSNEVQEHNYNGFSITNLPLDMQENVDQHGEDHTVLIMDPNEAHFNDQWGSTTVRSSNVGFPFSLPDSWKSNFLCDSSSEISTGFSTNKCYS